MLRALIGGAMIGAAACVLLACNGRIAGISGILGRVLLPDAGAGWRLAFLAGLLGGAWLCYATFNVAPPARSDFPDWLLSIAGLFVGFGTTMAHGCTSGHGVCGLGRLSLRALTATLTFVATAMLSTFVVRHVFAVQ